MLFTVIIPTCRRPDGLVACLDCLGPGRQKNFSLLGPADALPGDDGDYYEIAISDDGDAASTRARIGERSKWTRVEQGPRRGPAANRNHAAKAARGEWLAFTDDDCLPSGGWLRAYRLALRSDTAALEGMTVTDEPLRALYWHAPVNVKGGMLWSCNMLYRKSVFEGLGGFDEGFPYPHLEDVDLRERLLAKQGSFAFAPEAIVAHPQRARKPGLRLARQKESDFYYARKWGISPAAAGFNFRVLARVPLRQLVRARLQPASAEYALRLCVYWAALAWLSISWRRKYVGR